MSERRESRFERRMSDQEALMWNVEKDPWLNPNGAAITIFDQEVDFDALRRRMAFAVSELSRLRERPVPGLGRLSPPVWATDAEFDLDFHLRHVSLPAPGTMRHLLDLATRVYEDPFDRTRPLWVFYVVDGLEGGKGAMISKLHHSVADGIGALRMAEAYTELERDTPLPPEVDLAAIVAAAAEAEASELRESGADMGDSLLDTAMRSAGHVFRRQAGMVQRAVGEVAGWPADPKAAVDKVTGLVGTVRRTADTATGGREVDAGVPLFTNRSRNRRLEVLHFDFRDAKAAAKTLGGTLNDFFVTGVVLGALAYHAERDVEVDALNVSFVVSTRTDDAMGGNSFTPVPLQVRGDDRSIEDRFRDTHDRIRARRATVSGGGAMATIAGVVNLLPTSVITRVARDQARKLDLATSNLPGAPFPTYVGGALVEHIFPIGPVAGTAGNITLLAQNGTCDVGLFLDPAAVDDPPGLRAHVQQAFTDLLEAGGIVSAPARKPARKRAGQRAGAPATA